jgi:hypothetical protein
MSNAHFAINGRRTALRLRTGHDTLPKEEKCKMCKDGFSDKQGHHELSCAGQGHRILRHNAIRDCLFDLGLKAAMTVRKEPRHLLFNGLTSSSSTNYPNIGCREIYARSYGLGESKCDAFLDICNKVYYAASEGRLITDPPKQL